MKHRGKCIHEKYISCDIHTAQHFLLITLYIHTCIYIHIYMYNRRSAGIVH